ncbi:hypothetical protein BDP27DRAFT_1248345, partial [Rhodocollybia butyracea]
MACELVNNILDKADINAVKMFKLNIKGWLTRQAFAGIRSLFSDELNLNSEWKTIQRMHQLAEIEPQWYDCCIRGCMAYTGNYSELDVCQYCKEPRHNQQGKSKRQYCYIPLIPRIKGFFQNKSMIKLMQYRHNYSIDPDAISDVFDSDGYRNLLTRHVVVDGQKLPHKYFDGKYDIAFAFWHDGHQLF